MVCFFLGTKAQYIKTAPVIKWFNENGLAFRIVDSGQHGETSKLMFDDLGLRRPHVLLGRPSDVTSYPQAVWWLLKLLLLSFRSRRFIRANIFGGSKLCVVHGDTPTTLLSFLLARRAGIAVAHLETGVTSGRLFRPFPEEIVRRIVMRRSNLCFALGRDAANMVRLRNPNAEVFEMNRNTTGSTLSTHLRQSSDSGLPDGVDYCVATFHRVEALRSREICEKFVDLLEQCSQRFEVRLFLHGPTRRALARHRLLLRVESLRGIKVQGLVEHSRFVAELYGAAFVITDGGSIHEEAHLLGVPTLVWRSEVEVPFGVGENAVISGFDMNICAEFLVTFESFRRPAISAKDDLIEEIGSTLVKFSLGTESSNS